MFKLFSAAAAGLALLIAGATTIAVAEPVWQVGEGYVIRYQDLDLATVPGRAALLARLETTADRACRGEMLRVDERACRERMIDAALTAAGPARPALRLAMSERAGALDTVGPDLATNSPAFLQKHSRPPASAAMSRRVIPTP